MNNIHPIIKEAIRSIEFLSSINHVFFLKDIDGRYLALTDYASYVYGLNENSKIIGRTTLEAFGDTYRTISHQITELDKYLLRSDLKSISSINFFNYKDNIQSRMVFRYKLIDPKSRKPLGILYEEISSGLNNDCVSILGSLGQKLIKTSLKYNAHDIIKTLTPYEHELCFLISLGWSIKQIQAFMNNISPDKPRSFDAIIKKKNVICHKFNFEYTNISALQDFLVLHKIYKQIPLKLLSRLEGSYLIE